MPCLSHAISLWSSRPAKRGIAQRSLAGIEEAQDRTVGTNRGAWRGSGSARMAQGGAAGPYWLMKTEPGEWGWRHQCGGFSNWDEVRNALAQIHLRSMRQGDHAFFYHSGKGAAVVGVVEILAAAYPDATDAAGKSVMVDVRALAAFPKPVPLALIRSQSALHDWILLRQSRLSVMPVPRDVWQRVCELGELQPPLCRNNAETLILPDAGSREPAQRVVIPSKRRRACAEPVQVSAATAALNRPEEPAQVKMYQRSSRKRTAAAAEPSASAKTHNSRESKKNVAIDPPPNVKTSNSVELRTYQRSSRNRSEALDTPTAETKKPRGVKKRRGDGTAPNPKP